MGEETCPPLPQLPGLDWQNIRTKCPCCGTAMKLVLSWKAEGFQLDLMPEAQVDQNLQQPHQANNSLMNIVSVSSDHRLADHQTPSHSSNDQQSASTGLVNQDDDSHEPRADDSNSSFQSTDSQSQNVSADSNKQQQSDVTPADMMEQSLHSHNQVQVCHPLPAVAAGKDVSSVSHIFQPFHVPHTDGTFKCQFEGLSHSHCARNLMTLIDRGDWCLQDVGSRMEMCSNWNCITSGTKEKRFSSASGRPAVVYSPAKKSS